MLNVDLIDRSINDSRAAANDDVLLVQRLIAEGANVDYRNVRVRRVCVRVFVLSRKVADRMGECAWRGAGRRWAADLLCGGAICAHQQGARRFARRQRLACLVSFALRRAGRSNAPRVSHLPS